MSYATITTTSNFIFTVPVMPDAWRNGIYLSLISHDAPGQGFCQGSYIGMELVDSSGWEAAQIFYSPIGRPRPGHEAPVSSRVLGYGQKACGWFVRLVAPFGAGVPFVSRPSTSGVNYVQFRLRTRFGTAAVSGFLVEEGPPLDQGALGFIAHAKTLSTPFY
jgi:hypothetical protein